MLFSDLLYLMLVWIITFIATMLFFYVMTQNFPQFGSLNSLIVAIFGFTLGYLLGSYFLGAGVVMIPLIF